MEVTGICVMFELKRGNIITESDSRMQFLCQKSCLPVHTTPVWFVCSGLVQPKVAPPFNYQPNSDGRYLGAQLHRQIVRFSNINATHGE